MLFNDLPRSHHEGFYIALLKIEVDLIHSVAGFLLKYETCK